MLLSGGLVGALLDLGLAGRRLRRAKGGGTRRIFGEVLTVHHVQDVGLSCFAGHLGGMLHALPHVLVLQGPVAVAAVVEDEFHVGPGIFGRDVAAGHGPEFGLPEGGAEADPGRAGMAVLDIEYFGAIGL